MFKYCTPSVVPAHVLMQVSAHLQADQVMCSLGARLECDAGCLSACREVIAQRLLHLAQSHLTSH